jgi:hypothetical protein
MGKDESMALPVMESEKREKKQEEKRDAGAAHSSFPRKPASRFLPHEGLSTPQNSSCDRNTQRKNAMVVRKLTSIRPSTPENPPATRRLQDPPQREVMPVSSSVQMVR